MLVLLSPSKSLNLENRIPKQNFTTPNFLKDSQILIDQLRQFSAKEIGELMDISEKLSELNFQRFQNFQTPFNLENSKPAIFIFDGDVYDGIDATNYSKDDLEFSQNHLRILSGLYGILRPLDLIQAYRLEMGISFKNPKGKNLYEFWSKKITDFLNEELEKQKNKIIINLASEEYFKAVAAKKINGKIINVIFKELKGNDYKIIGIMAKKARGLMANHIIKNHLTNPEEIKKFNLSGYKFRQEFSDENNFVFTR